MNAKQAKRLSEKSFITAERSQYDAMMVEIEKNAKLGNFWATIPSKLSPATIERLRKDGYRVVVYETGVSRVVVEWDEA